MPSVRLSDSARVTILSHARDTYPHECCGALYGPGDGVILEALPLANATEEGPRRRFLVRDRDYVAAEAYAKRSGQALMGFYHSHPDHPARPSEHDRVPAMPNFIYLITSVLDGRADETTAWQLREDRSQFDELRLE